MVRRAGIRTAGRFGLLLGGVLILLLAAAPLLSESGDSAPPARASGDLDGNGKEEEYFLKDGALAVREGSEELWASSADWHVDSFALGDVDNDGKTELVMSLWKKGSFGTIRPFWHTGTDTGYRNHLFVYKFEENTCKPVWCSSDLAHPILSFAVRDVDGDGLNEMVVEEGKYHKVTEDEYAPDPDGSVRTTVWQWEEWGFRLRSD